MNTEQGQHIRIVVRETSKAQDKKYEEDKPNKTLDDDWNRNRKRIEIDNTPLSHADRSADCVLFGFIVFLVCVLCGFMWFCVVLSRFSSILFYVVLSRFMSFTSFTRLCRVGVEGCFFPKKYSNIRMNICDFLIFEFLVAWTFSAHGMD